MRSIDLQINELENRLNLHFDNTELFIAALTHSSYANGKKNVKFNERLEFLGDSVLQLCITEYLFRKYKNKTEGELTKIRSLIVCELSLHGIAKKWELGKYIYMSRGEELTGGRERTSILADAVEAVIGSVYLDKGINEAFTFILNNFSEIIIKAVNNTIVIDFKTKLQEKLQQNGDVAIEYEIFKQEGPPHRRIFFSKVIINSKTLGYGTGYSKKESEQCAAQEALINLEDKNE